MAAFALLVVASSAGCAEPDDDLTEEPAPIASQQAGGAQVVNVQSASAGISEVQVTANGTGCPSGTTRTSVAADGKSFTTTFLSFELGVSPNSTVSVKDCQLGFQMKRRGDVQFAVDAYSIEGQAKLDKDVNAKLIASYYFQGNPSQSRANEHSLTGPYDRSFQLQGSFAGSGQVWSPCGVDRNINLVTRARLMNSVPSRNGTVTAKTLVVRLTQRNCP